nr:hypothetical protein [Actinomycetes bacterium]
MLVEEEQGNAFEGLRRERELREDVDAVLLLVHQALQPRIGPSIRRSLIKAACFSVM